MSCNFKNISGINQKLQFKFVGGVKSFGAFFIYVNLNFEHSEFRSQDLFRITQNFL